eukprot:TRINITY_DN2208_c0_g2_i1.p1 TRINITY_DN2208_c0_g2~~TRINITY_DN2208_c0_g2_i1.p1  ORF type:complete len:1456 (+),score=535.39 TRINITY_DN2208_c0_g2_i1:111-4478(+)
MSNNNPPNVPYARQLQKSIPSQFLPPSNLNARAPRGTNRPAPNMPPPRSAMPPGGNNRPLPRGVPHGARGPGPIPRGQIQQPHLQQPRGPPRGQPGGRPMQPMPRGQLPSMQQQQQQPRGQLPQSGPPQPRGVPRGPPGPNNRPQPPIGNKNQNQQQNGQNANANENTRVYKAGIQGPPTSHIKAAATGQAVDKVPVAGSVSKRPLPPRPRPGMIARPAGPRGPPPGTRSPSKPPSPEAPASPLRIEKPPAPNAPPPGLAPPAGIPAGFLPRGPGRPSPLPNVRGPPMPNAGPGPRGMPPVRGPPGPVHPPSRPPAPTSQPQVPSSQPQPPISQPVKQPIVDISSDEGSEPEDQVQVPKQVQPKSQPTENEIENNRQQQEQIQEDQQQQKEEITISSKVDKTEEKPVDTIDNKDTQDDDSNVDNQEISEENQSEKEQQQQQSDKPEIIISSDEEDDEIETQKDENLDANNENNDDEDGEGDIGTTATLSDEGDNEDKSVTEDDKPPPPRPGPPRAGPPGRPPPPGGRPLPPGSRPPPPSGKPSMAGRPGPPPPPSDRDEVGSSGEEDAEGEALDTLRTPRTPTAATATQANKPAGILKPSARVSTRRPSQAQLTALSASAGGALTDVSQNESATAGLFKTKPIPGRLEISLLHGRSIEPKTAAAAAKAVRTNPYVVAMYTAPTGEVSDVKSRVFEKCNKHPNFGGEIINLDLFEPRLNAIRDGTNAQEFNDTIIYVQVWDHRPNAEDFLLGESKISIARFFDEHSRRHKSWFQLKLKPGAPNGTIQPLPLKDNPSQAQQEENSNRELVSAGEIELKMDFMRVLPGMLSVKLIEGKNLQSIEMLDRLNPYCTFKFGDMEKRSKTIKGGGKDPYFKEEEVLLWIGKNNWNSLLEISCFDQDIASNDKIGDTTLSVVPFTNKSLVQNNFSASDEWVELKRMRKPTGDLHVRMQFFPAGELTFQPITCRGLLELDPNKGSQDPFVRVTATSKATSHSDETLPHVDGGRRPQWNEIMSFEIVDQYELLIEVLDFDPLSDHKLIAKTTLSIMEAFKFGRIKDWFQMEAPPRFPSDTNAGEIQIMCEFEGPPGVGYPQRQPNFDRFDEKERINVINELERLQHEQLKERAAERRRLGVAADVASDIFTDQEIEDAFKIIDLNRNLYLSAAEIRHVLVCMGELVTDEEIDEMIRMVDIDGDGQVSFTEFKRVCQHPDPSSDDFARQQKTVLAQLADGDFVAPDETSKDLVVTKTDTQGAKALFPGGVPSAPAAMGTESKKQSIEERKREAEAKNLKKDLLRRIIADNHIDFSSVQRAFSKFLNRDLNHSGAADLQLFCSILALEMTGEVTKLFKLFDGPSTPKDTVNIREVFLAMTNFTEADKAARIRFAFMMFDEDRSGFISEDELIKILKANHIAARDEQVARKAKTIMKQCDDDGDNTINLQEFMVISQKFPNILFPSFT